MVLGNSYKVSQIHSLYSSTGVNYYDVALLMLSSPFDVSLHPHVGVACLEPHMPPPGTTCYSMGWGRDYDGSPHAAVLKKVKTSTLSSDLGGIF